jgi:hypothetical protein
MGGNVDRGGGRESKGGSLRKSKQGRAELAKAAASTPREVRPDCVPPKPPVSQLPPSTSKPPPPADLLAAPLLDCCCALLSRQFDRDREAVLRRAAQSRVAALVLHCSDVDRQKELLALAKSAPGVLYCALGALPDNLKRTNEKQMAGWLADRSPHNLLSTTCSIYNI